MLFALLAPPLAALLAGSTPSKPLLVCTTASSLEGMAFCKQVLERGEFRVRALCRNLESPRATALAHMGAEVVQGDNLDPDGLRLAFDGAHGVYGITTWSGSSFDASGRVVRSERCNDAAFLEESEFSQGMNIIAAAEATPSMQHFIMQSMHRSGRDSIDDTVEAPMHHRAKWRLEAELLKSSLDWSILRQPTYLENFGNDDVSSEGTQLRLIRPGVISGLLDEDVELTVIAVEDLGSLAAAMFERREEFLHRTLVAGAERTSGRRLAEAATRVNGKMHFAYRKVPWYVLELFIPVEYPKRLKRWLTLGGNDEGATPHADEMLSECRRLHPDMMTVEEWLRARGVANLEPPPKASLARVQRLVNGAVNRRLASRRAMRSLRS